MANYTSIMIDLDQIPQGQQRLILVDSEGMASVVDRIDTSNKFEFTNQRYIKVPYTGFSQVMVFEEINNGSSLTRVFENITSSVQIEYIEADTKYLVIRATDNISGYVLLS